MTGWQFLEENEMKIRALARKMAHGNTHLTDELFDVAVDRLPRIVEDLWDKERDLSRYAMYNLRMYMMKMRNRRYREVHRDIELCEDPSEPTPEQEIDVGPAMAVMSLLSRKDRQLLVLKHCDGLTFGEISRELGVAKGTAVRYYQRALASAQYVAALTRTRE